MMTTAEDLREKFLNTLDKERTMMLGLAGVDEGHTRPMTAMREDGRGPIWFFTSTDNTLVRALAGQSGRAIGTFTAKGHDLFATVHGTLRVDTRRDVIDRLWNPFIAAWYEGGKDDPTIALLRLEAESAEIWEADHGILAGIKALLGADPKDEYRDKTAEVRL